MNKILFLDIDGVLNSYEWMYSWYQQLKTKIYKVINNGIYNQTNMINRWSLFLLGLLCKIRKYDVVLSSSWRFGWDVNGNPDSKLIKNVDKLFRLYNVNIIGRTTLSKCDVNKNYSISLDYCPEVQMDKKSFWRGTQILNYIENHNVNISECLIIDDDVVDIGIYDCLKRRLLNTEFYGKRGGFRLKQFIKALRY